MDKSSHFRGIECSWEEENSIALSIEAIFMKQVSDHGMANAKPISSPLNPDLIWI